MSTVTEEKAVGDDVPKVDGVVAVGEDLAFQRRWWRFERAIWIVFILILVADLAGLLGRGPLANASRQTSDSVLRVKYERVMRENTASIMTLLPADAAIHNGKLQIFVSDSLVKQFGAQRIIPQPETTTVGNGGLTYTFPATATPMTMQIELKPSFIGPHTFHIGIFGGEVITAKSLVLP